MSLLVRAAAPADAAAIARVHVRSWQVGYAGLLPADVLAGLDAPDALEARRRRWAELLAGGGRTLVVATPEVVGFASIGPSRDAPDEGELMAFYLDPDSWGRGVAAALHRVVVAELDREHPRSILWVLAGNERAQRFYRAGGWADDGGTKVESEIGGIPVRLDEVRFAR